ncbi:glutathione S-transferase [Aureimonas sp. SA4125]|uniref:glutathione S-transferase n=1 Tax=Aureimonas sp. SA4125 TaxID=2826993 RepID=UPI001CC70CB3|nr:glutathione S-transferase [Aureimonas sp. SA4125]BDA86682.1 glutathione S-transferase [Aureimonas sp. SA4125]
MITLHHLNNSRSQRILWLLEELGLEYAIERHQRDPRTLQAPASLRAIHPLGKAPVITEDGLTLAETGAIVDYLTEKTGRFGPPASGTTRWRYRHFLHYAEGSAMPPLVMKLVFSRIPAGMPRLLRPLMRPVFAKLDRVFLEPQLQLHADYWEQALEESGWFAGPDITAADIMMSFPLETARSRVGFDARPNCRAFLDQIHARPAYIKALEVGGAYAYA